MRGSGIKASALIKELEKLIAKHGDREVYSGGEDYPGPCNGVAVQVWESAYVPQGVFKVVAG